MPGSDLYCILCPDGEGESSDGAIHEATRRATRGIHGSILIGRTNREDSITSGDGNPQLHSAEPSTALTRE